MSNNNWGGQARPGQELHQVAPSLQGWECDAGLGRPPVQFLNPKTTSDQIDKRMLIKILVAYTALRYEDS